MKSSLTSRNQRPVRFQLSPLLRRSRSLGCLRDGVFFAASFIEAKASGHDVLGNFSERSVVAGTLPRPCNAAAFPYRAFRLLHKR